MRIIVDQDKCTGLGICESLAEKYFEIDDDGSLVLLTEEVSESDLADVEAAVSNCPTAALRLERNP